MKTAFKVIPLVFALLLFASLFILCSNETKENGMNTNNNLTVEYFKENITKDMKYDEIVKIFGEPLKDIGSGIHIFVYKLVDSTEIWIGYVDEIYYVKHMDKDGNLIEDIISNN